MVRQLTSSRCLILLGDELPLRVVYKLIPQALFVWGVSLLEVVRYL